MASGKVKGITVEIGGDTTKLGKALEGSEKQSRALQVELRQIEKLLKFDPTNTELLAQKQKVLADMVEQTSQKLDTLKEAEAQVIAQFERGEIAEDQLRAFQREIVQTENTLGKMKGELSDATRNMNEFGDNNGVAKEKAAQLEKEIQEQNDALEAEKKALQEAAEAQKKHEEEVSKAKETLSDFKEKSSDAFDKVKTGAIAAGTAVAGMSGYALKVSTDFDQAFNQLITKTGASKTEFESLNTAMENVYKNNFGESIEDVANSMATVKINTGLAGTELQKATEHALLMRDVFEFDVNESTRSAKMLMDQFGLSSEQAYNLMAQGAQSGLDKNGDLLDTINEYSVHFAQLGLGAEDMFNMLVNGAENGTFSVDKLGDAVKEFGIRVKDGTADNAFQKLGFDVDETTKKFAQGGAGAKQALSEVTTALFNMDDPVQQNILGVELFGTMWEDLGLEGVKALMDITGEVSTTKDALNEMNELRYDDIGSALQGLGRTIQTDVVNPLGEQLQPTVEELIDDVQANAPAITSVLTGIGTVVTDFINFIVNNAPLVVGLITGIGTAFLAWKVAGIINAVVGAINAFKLANEGATVAQWLLNAAMNANPIGILVSVIAGVVAALGVFIFTNDDARAKVVAAWEWIKSTVSSVVDSLVTFFTVTIPTAWSGFTAWLSGFVNTVVQYFSTLPGRIWAFLSKVIQDVIKWGTNIVTNGKKYASNFVTNVINFMKQIPSKVWNAIQAAITNVTKWGTDIVNKGKQSATNFVNNVYNTMKNIPSKVTSAIQGAISAVSSWGSQMVSKAKSACNSVVNAVVSTLRTIPGKVTSIGKSIVSGLWSGISSMAGWIKSKAASLVSGIVSSMKSKLKINSPSKLVRDEVGSPIAEGVAVGIEDNTEMPIRAVENMNDDILKHAESFGGIDFNRKLENTFNNNLNTANRPIEDLVTLVAEYMPRLVELSQKSIVLDSGVLVGELGNSIDLELGNINKLRGRGR